jgi:hypothetical protein
MGADTAYPYQGENFAQSVQSVIQQGFSPNASTAAACNAIVAAIAGGTTPVNIIAYSGGEAFSAAWDELTAAQKAMIGQILYITPGTPLANNGQASTVLGSGPANGFLHFTTTPVGSVTQTNCAHTDLSCLFSTTPGTSEFNALTSMWADGSCSSPQQFTLSNPVGTYTPHPVTGGAGGGFGWVIVPWPDIYIPDGADGGRR